MQVNPIALEHVDQAASRLQSLTQEIGRISALLSSGDFCPNGSTERSGLVRRVGVVSESVGPLAADIRNLRKQICGPQATPEQLRDRFVTLASVYDRLHAVERHIEFLTTLIWQRHLASDRSELTTARSISYTESPRLFGAIDATVALIIELIFGTTAVREFEARRLMWMPHTILGDNFMIDPAFGIAKVPRAELNRSRLWPLFAHELAHIRFAACREGHVEPKWALPSGVRADRYKKMEFDPRELCQARDAVQVLVYGAHSDAELLWRGSAVSSRVVERRAEELICDAVAIQVMGPSYLLAFLAQVPLRVPRGDQESDYRQLLASPHPPPVVRCENMIELLRSLGEAEWVDSSGIRPFMMMHYKACHDYRKYTRTLRFWRSRRTAMMQACRRASGLLVPPETQAQAYSRAEGTGGGGRDLDVRTWLTRGWKKRAEIRNLLEAKLPTGMLFDSILLTTPSTFPSIVQTMLEAQEALVGRLAENGSRD